jgi:hypothetical protein
MWKKKRPMGSVTVYDNEPKGLAGTMDDEYADLGLATGPTPHGYGTEQDLEQMSAAELEALAIASAQSGSQGTARALAMALETREIGVNTAHTMKQQTEQLERLGNEIEVVHDYLDKSERIIDKMSKPKLVRLFHMSKKDGKGLDKVKGSRRDHAERDALKAHGLDSVDVLDSLDGDGEGSAEGAKSEPRDDLLEVHDVKKNGKYFKPASSLSGVHPSRPTQEDYSQYSTGVATAMRKQDQDLDQISDALADMKALADGMNAELTYQDKLITEIQDFTEETSRRTKDHARRVNQIK